MAHSKDSAARFLASYGRRVGAKLGRGPNLRTRPEDEIMDLLHRLEVRLGKVPRTQAELYQDLRDDWGESLGFRVVESLLLRACRLEIARKVSFDRDRENGHAYIRGPVSLRMLPWGAL